MTAPKIMTREDELAFAVATLLAPDLFRNTDVAWGHVPKERARHIKRAHRVIKLIRLLDFHE